MLDLARATPPANPDFFAWRKAGRPVVERIIGLLYENGEQPMTINDITKLLNVSIDQASSPIAWLVQRGFLTGDLQQHLQQLVNPGAGPAGFTLTFLAWLYCDRMYQLIERSKLSRELDQARKATLTEIPDPHVTMAAMLQAFGRASSTIQGHYSLAIHCEREAMLPAEFKIFRQPQGDGTVLLTLSLPDVEEPAAKGGARGEA